MGLHSTGLDRVDMRWDTKLVTLLFGQASFFLKIMPFFVSHVCGCHLAVNRTFLMILDAQKTLDHCRHNALKIIEKRRAISELWLSQYRKVKYFPQGNKITSFYRNLCYKKVMFFKKMKPGRHQLRVPSHMFILYLMCVLILTLYLCADYVFVCADYVLDNPHELPG